MPPPGSRAGSRSSCAGRDASTTASRGWRRRTTSSRTTSRTRTSGCWCSGWAWLLFARRLRTRAASGSTARPSIGGGARLPQDPRGRVQLAAAILRCVRGRPQERLALLRQAREIALEHDLEALGSIYFNLSDAQFFRDRYEDALGYLHGASRSRGGAASRLGEWATLAETTWPLLMLGRWDEALEYAGQIPEDRLQDTTTLSLLESVALITIARGDPAEARRILGLYPETSTDVQERSSVLAARASVLRAEGRPEDALGAALECLEAQAGGTEAAVFSTQHGKQSFQLIVEILVELGRRAEAAEWIARYDRVPPGIRPPFVEAQAHRLRALLDGDPAGFAAAASAFDELRIPFWAAVARLERAEHLDAGEERERLLGDARAEFERLEARPWLDRADAARSAGLAEVPA